MFKEFEDLIKVEWNACQANTDILVPGTRKVWQHCCKYFLPETTLFFLF